MPEIGGMGGKRVFKGKITIISRPVYFLVPLPGGPKGDKTTLPIIINPQGGKVFFFEREKQASFHFRIFLSPESVSKRFSTKSALICSISRKAIRLRRINRKNTLSISRIALKVSADASLRVTKVPKFKPDAEIGQNGTFWNWLSYLEHVSK